MRKKGKVNKIIEVKQPGRFKAFFSNPWKIAFLVLLAIILAFGIVIGIRISTPRMSYNNEQQVSFDKSEPILEVLMTKQQVNSVVDYYAKDLMKDSGVDYSFTLEKDALIDGTFSLMGHDTHFYLYFEPYVLSNGNVQLEAKSLSIGALHVPIPAVINYISHSVDFPNWVEIKPDDSMIILHLDSLELPNGMRVRAEQINLVDDQIRFSLFLPEKAKPNKKQEN